MTGRQSRKQQEYEELLGLIGRDFDRRMFEDPDFGEDLPSNAYILFQIDVKGETDAQLQDQVEDFNRWVQEVCRPQVDPDHNLVTATLVIEFGSIADPRHPARRKRLTDEMIEHTPREFELQPA